MAKKFRFYDKECKQWRELPDLLGDYVSCAFRTYGDGFDIKYFLNSEARTKVKDGIIVIQQWTGFLDKTDREIYEGDICSFNWLSGPSRDCVESAEGEVFFEDGIFCFGRKELFCWVDCNFLTHTLKVVGNIFEN